MDIREPSPGARLADRYELMEEIGRGGLGVVHRARDLVLERDVAVKLLPPSRVGPAEARRFQREAAVVAQLDHPAIVPVFDFGRHGQTLFFVMPLLHGQTLRRILADDPLDPGQAMAICAQVASALAHSHGAGVIHRDVKPENVMVDGGRRVRVMDFGLALDTAGPRTSHSGEMPGTVAYLSPEQVLGVDVDGRADVYALGVVLYECLVGEVPFAGPLFSNLYRTVHEPAPRLPNLGTEVDVELSDLVARCLAKRPEDRPSGAAEVALALRELGARLPPAPAGVADLVLPVPSGLPNPRRLALLPLVGRAAEQAALRKALEDVLAGASRLVLVRGDVGVGKTRLLEEAELWARQREARVLHGRSSGTDREHPFQGMGELIQDGLRPGRGSSSSTSVAPSPSGVAPALSDVDLLADLAPELLDLFPELAELGLTHGPPSGILAPDSKAPTAPGASSLTTGSPDDPVRTFELLARAYGRLAGGRPLVLALEGLRGGDLAARALRYLVDQPAGPPILVLATLRPEEAGPGITELSEDLRRDPRGLVLDLGPLDRGELGLWLPRLLGRGTVDPALVDRIHRATDGNPLFVRDLVTELRESGDLVLEGDSWTLPFADPSASDPPHFHLESPFPDAVLAKALPGGLRRGAEDRVDRLDGGARRVLEAASVLGRRVDVGVLEGMMGPAEDGTAGILDRFVEQEFLGPGGDTSGNTLTFRSGVLRDVLYRSLSRRRRRSLHRRCLKCLEAGAVGSVDRIDAQLLHHSLRADEAERSVRYGLALARRTLASGAAGEAVAAARCALGMVDGEDVDDPVRREAELLEVLALAHRASGDLPQACDRAEEAFGRFEGLGDGEGGVSTALLAAESAWQDRRIETARRWVDRGSGLARARGAVEPLRRLLTLGATLASLRGEHQQARSFLDEAETLEASSVEGDAQELPRGGRLVTALPNPVRHLWPQDIAIDEESELATNVFETLVGAGEQGRPTPLLCRGWRSSENGRRFDFDLRSEVCFSDGTALTAEGVRDSLERAARAVVGRLSPGVFTSLVGMEDFLSGTARHVEGIEVLGRASLALRLTSPLPILPALLTDPRTAVARAGSRGMPLGTGPFRYAATTDLGAGRVVLERNPRYWRHGGPKVDVLEWRTGVGSPSIAAGLRSGDIDIGRDLLPRDLEALLEQSRWRDGLVEATRKNVYFVLFHRSGPLAGRPGIRRALASALWTQDLVWRALGRFARPALCLIPPGVLGHDPGRRRRRVPMEEIRGWLAAEIGLGRRPRLRAAVHPSLRDRHGALFEAIGRVWGRLGFEIEVVGDTVADFHAAYRDEGTLDLLLDRWNLDYDDPDNFTYNILHSDGGMFRRFFSDPEADRLLEQAREAPEAATRVDLYRRLEALLEDRGAIVPLFHDVDYRLARRDRVSGLTLGPVYPYVAYDQLARAPTPGGPGPGVGPQSAATKAASVRVAARGRVDVALGWPLRSLDPGRRNNAERLEALGNVYETLTRVDRGGQLVPHLASTLAGDAAGLRFRFRLRPEARFHDGRPILARDVRYAFERLVADPALEGGEMLLPIRGARALRRGDAAGLSGIQIQAERELIVELRHPLPFFPSLLAHPGTAIVPEGAMVPERGDGTGRVGSGPFRVVEFDPGVRLELERHPDYRRPGLPRLARLCFHFGVTPEAVAEGFRAGNLSLAGDLLAEDLAGIRQTTELAAGFAETPKLGTYFLAFDTRRGALADAGLRRALAQGLDVDELLRAAGGTVSRAHGLIPPGLLGYESRRRRPPARPDGADRLRGLELRAAVHPSLLGPHRPLWNRLVDLLGDLGITVTQADRPFMGSLPTARASLQPASPREGEPAVESRPVDLVATRWIADYPDSDSFVQGLHHLEGRGVGGLAGGDCERLGSRARQEAEPSLRHSLYRQLEDLLAKDARLLPLFHERAYRLAQPGLQGLRLGLSFPEVAYERLWWGR
ncbi:MAG: ABC transporter substrate-binding protein [Acidobacteriota bacterium]